MMGQPLTLAEVAEAGLPASAEGELYRYEPTQGFFRATATRFAPCWLPIPWPAHGNEVLWYHDDGCTCRFCHPAPATAAQPAPEQELERTA